MSEGDVCNHNYQIIALNSPEDPGVFAHFDQIWRFGFRVSWLTNIVAIDLQKPYAKSESGANLVMYDVY